MRVIIIGGGIIGSLTACFLKLRGADVTVLERGKLGQEASWAGAGILSPIHPWLYPDSFTHLINASLALYPKLHEQLLTETGIDAQWLQSGLMVPLFEDDKIHHRQHAIAWSEKFNWKLQTLDAQETLQQEPTLNPQQLSGSLLWPDVAQVRNPRLLKAVRAWMQKLGITLHEQCEVSKLIHSPDGQVCGAESTSGLSFQGDAVLLAGGSWSGQLAKSMGFSLPVQPVKGQIVLLKGEPGLVHHIIKHDDAYFVPRSDGRILVGASMEFVGFQRGNTQNIVKNLLSAMQKMTPDLQQLDIEHQWMGFRPGTPDGLPFLGAVPEKDGLWVASGHYRNGVVLAPITAELMSQQILGEKSRLEITDFSITRHLPEKSPLGFPSTSI